MDQNKQQEEPVDTSTFMNNNPVLVAADWFWSKVCNPVVSFFEKIGARLTQKWVDERLELLEEAERYRKEREAKALNDTIGKV